MSVARSLQELQAKIPRWYYKEHPDVPWLRVSRSVLSLLLDQEAPETDNTGCLYFFGVEFAALRVPHKSAKRFLQLWVRGVEMKSQLDFHLNNAYNYVRSKKGNNDAMINELLNAGVGSKAMVVYRAVYQPDREKVPFECSLNALVAETGFPKSTVKRCIQELEQKRFMMTILPGGPTKADGFRCTTYLLIGAKDREQLIAQERAFQESAS